MSTDAANYEDLDLQALRQAIQDEYATVAEDPGRGFHFHTGWPLARLLGYQEEWLREVPEEAIAPFAGTGNPHTLGDVRPRDRGAHDGCGPRMHPRSAA